MTHPTMPELPAPFIGVQDQPWGGHAEVIRSAIGEPGVISCYTADQMLAYGELVREACAKVCDGQSDELGNKQARAVASRCARAIRSMGSKGNG